MFHKLHFGVVVFLVLLCVFLLFQPSWAQEATPTPVPTAMPVAGPVPNSLTISAKVDPPALIPGQEAEVIITLRGEDLAECFGVPGWPLDAIIYVDNSASAGVGLGSKLEEAKDMALVLVDQMAQVVYADPEKPPAYSRFGMVTASTVVTGVLTTISELSEDIPAAQAAVQAIGSGADVALVEGIRLAVGELQAKVRPDSRRMMLTILHDDVPFTEDATQAAAQAQAAGIDLYIIALGDKAKISPNDEAETLVGPENVYYNPTPDDIRRLFIRATGGTPNVVARGIKVIADLAPADAVSILSWGAGGAVEAGELVWRLPEMGRGETAELTARIGIKPTAEIGQVELTADVIYVDCNGYLATEAIIPGPIPVPIQSPTPTPLPTPTGVLSATPTATATGLPPAIPPIPIPPMTPVTLTFSLCPGDTSPSQTLTAFIPPAPPKADVLFVFDISGSMSGVLQSAALNADQIMDGLSRLIADVQMGVVSVTDYPFDPYGGAGDHPYLLWQAITSDRTLIKSALSALPGSLEYGADGPEAYTRALYEMYSDPAIGWREGARQLVLFFGDSIPHDDDLNASVPQPLSPGEIWRTGYAPTFLDPGRDETTGTADDLDFQAVLEELEEEDTTLLFVFSASSDILSELVNWLASLLGVTPDADDILRYWDHWAGLTGAGGEAVSLEDAAQLPQTVLDIISRVGKELSLLTLEADPGYQGWVAVQPSEYRSQAIGDAGLSLPFQTTVSVPSSVQQPDTYRFALRAVGDGTTYVTWNVEVRVLPACRGVVVPTSPHRPSPAPIRSCEEWWWKWLLPLLLPLLVLLLWWLVRRLLRRRRPTDAPPPRLRCWLPCLLALLYTMFVAYLFGQRLSTLVCITTLGRPDKAAISAAMATSATGTATPGGPVGQIGSQRVAAVITGGLFDLSSQRPGVTFTRIGLGDLSAAALAEHDTLVFSQVCNIGQLPKAQLNELVDWVAAGHKLIIYDSDECGQPVDYAWLPYQFSTDNPGAHGSSQGFFEIVADDSMISGDPTLPSYIDPAEFVGIEIGDANVMVTQDLRWCGNAEAVNLHGQRGFVHAYALYGGGLIIYNGLDTDNISSAGMYKLWQQELAQPWDSVTGKPMGLPCQRRVAGHVDLFGPVDVFGLSMPFWVLLLPIPILWFLCWLLCRQRVRRMLGYVWSMPPEAPPPRRPLPPVSWRRPPPVWRPAPTLIIGLGGTGRWVLTHLKKNLLDAGASEWYPQVRLLTIDVAKEELVNGKPVSVRFAGTQLAEDELLVIPENLGEVIRRMAEDRQAEPELAAWFPADDYNRRLREAETDVSRGTGQRRPVGRAVLFRDIQKGREASVLWQRLERELRLLAAGEHAEVFIIGSLAGGLGSAALGDVAYLVRRAARAAEVGGIPITAFLATDGAFTATAAGRSLHLKQNSMATLREVGRFLLARGRRYPMRYRRGSRDQLLDGVCEWSLFDDTFLFDGQREQKPLTRWEPQQALFPMMADVLTVLLDRNARRRESALAQYRYDTTRAAIADLQLRRAEAVVSSYGSFTYRLPMRDLVEALKTRFARDLVRTYLVGPEYKGNELALNVKQNREAHRDGVGTHAQQFLLSQAGGAAAFLLQLAVSSWSQPLQAQLHSNLAMADEGQGGRRGYVQRQVHGFRECLSNHVLRLLNGSPEADVITARCGKLAYTQAFLAEIASYLRQAHGQAGVLRSSLGSKEEVGVEMMQQLAEEYIAVVERLLVSLASRVDFLLTPTGVRQPGEGKRPVGLYQRLLAHEDALATQRREMEAIVVRRYFADEQLLDHLYRHYFADHVLPNLDRLFWQLRPDGELELVIRRPVTEEGGSDQLQPDDVAFSTDAEGQERFVAALLALAEAAGGDVWQLRLDPFLDEEDSGAWRQQRLAEAALDVRTLAEAPLTFEVGEASREAQQERFLWVNDTVKQAEPLAVQIARGAVGGTRVRLLSASDPYSATLLTSLDVLPLSALICYNRLSIAYRDEQGIVQGRPMLPSEQPEPVHVFAPEVNALHYERRLWELHERPRLFHPLFVSALDDLERARSFALAYALGLIWPLRDEKGDRRYRLRLPSLEKDVWLTRARTSGDPVALVAKAMQNFVLGGSLLGAVQQEFTADELARVVAAEVKEVVPTAEERLQRFLREVPETLREEQGIGADDLLSFSRLVVRDALQFLYEQRQG